MSERTKPWRRPRHNTSERKSYTAASRQLRDVAGLDIPHAARGGEDTRHSFRQCTRKRIFNDEQAAIRKAAERAEATGVPLRAYPCPHCGAWHIGSYGGPREP